MPSNHLVLCCPFYSCLQSFLAPPTDVICQHSSFQRMSQIDELEKLFRRPVEARLKDCSPCTHSDSCQHSPTLNCHYKTPHQICPGWDSFSRQGLTVAPFACCCCSATQSCLTLCDPMGCSMPSFPVLHYLLEFAQTQSIVKVLHSICQQIWKTQQWPQDWKKSPIIPIPNKGNAKECSNYHTIALISDASKVMLKILQARLQQYVNWELPDVQAGFRKGRGNRDQIANICWILKKARVFQKNIYFCFIDYTNGFDCVDHNKLWKILNEMGIPDHLTCLLRNLYADQEATVRTDVQTGSKLGKEYVKAVYCHPAYLTYM